MSELVDLPLEVPQVPFSAKALKLVEDARALERTIRCFSFVPSNYENAWSVLSSIAETESASKLTFCEWGSGMGVVTGLASLLGFQACGIELDADLAKWSQDFLRERAPDARIIQGSYFDLQQVADLVYIYAWASQTSQVEQQFLDLAPPCGRFLFCSGQDILQLRMRSTDIS